MRGTIYGRNSPVRQRRDGQLHRSPNYETTRDPDGGPRTTNSTYQRRWHNQPSRTNRKILRNDYPERTPKERHALLRNKPRGRSYNIRLPLAADLQPKNQLGKRKG